jgi:uncharacterized protein (TIGR03083 family)
VSRADRLDLTPMLRPERAAFVEVLNRLDESDWDAPTECPAWSVKGVALHVLGDDLSLLSRQRDEATNGLVLFAADHPGADFRRLLDGFNEQWVTAASFLSRELVLELLRLAGDWTAEFYEAVDLDAPGEPVGFMGSRGETSPYWQAIAREYVERWVHHHQIRRAVGRPDLGADFLRPAAEVVSHAVAGHLRDLDAPAIAATIPGIAAWTWTWQDQRWSVADGADEAAPVRLSLAAADATRVLSRGVAPTDLAGHFEISGDEDLGRRVLEALRPMLSPG